MQYKAVIFDLDGTLLDSLNDLANCMNDTLSRFGFPRHEVGAYRYFVGDGMRNLVCRAMPREVTDEKIIAACFAAMKEEYARRWNELTRPYPQIPELLQTLHSLGLKLAVLSNKPHEFTEMAVRELLPGIPFAAAFGERLGRPRKPDPAGALEILKILGVEAGQCLYLGDSSTDMRTATAAGVFPVGVLWGFRPAEELLANGARILLEKPLDLLKYMSEMCIGSDI